MGFLEPDIQDREVESQATPLAGDLLSFLRGQLGGVMGEAFGHQRQAGTALQQFLNSGGFNINMPNREGLLNPEIGGDFSRDVNVRDVSMPGSAELDELVASLEATQNRRVGEQSADLREGFGIAGSRFGTPLANTEGRFRRESEQDFMAELGQLLEGARRFDVGSDLQAQQMGIGRDIATEQLLNELLGLETQADVAEGSLALQGAGLDTQSQQNSIQNLLQGIMGLFGIGQGMQSPFLAMGSQGINPENTVVTDSGWLEFFRLLAGVGQGAAGGAAQGAAMAAAAAGSSEKFKENITIADEEDALEGILAMRFYQYNYKGSDKERVGLILEDPTTPEELKYGESIDVYSFLSKVALALQAVMRRLETQSA